jgi:hypothetical protein
MILAVHPQTQDTNRFPLLLSSIHARRGERRDGVNVVSVSEGAWGTQH